MRLVKEIANLKDDVVFVGSSSLKHLIPTIPVKDIDIVVTSLDGLDILGKIETWESKSPMSLSGQRAHIKRDDYNIDIFIEPNLPEYDLIDGVKFQTIEKFKSFIEVLIEVTKGEFKNKMIEKKKTLSSIV
jgi:hypothetical protein